jgi:hypothetical protein
MEDIFEEFVKNVSKVYKEFGLLSAIFGAILYVIVYVALFALKIFILMWLWNHTVPEIFTGVNEITFLQTMILYIFIKIVF